MTHTVGNIGTTFRAKVVDQNGKPVNLAAASTLSFYWRAPNGTVDTKTATLTSDGSDGLCEFTTTAASDLDQTGDWDWQVFVDFGATEWKSSIRKFTVGEAIA